MTLPHTVWTRWVRKQTLRGCYLTCSMVSTRFESTTGTDKEIFLSAIITLQHQWSVALEVNNRYTINDNLYCSQTLHWPHLRQPHVLMFANCMVLLHRVLLGGFVRQDDARYSTRLLSDSHKTRTRHAPDDDGAGAIPRCRTGCLAEQGRRGNQELEVFRHGRYLNSPQRLILL